MRGSSKTGAWAVGLHTLQAPTCCPAPPRSRALRVQTSHPPQACPLGSGLPLRLRPSLCLASDPGGPASQSGPLPGPSSALNYLTSGGCSAFSAALSRRSIAMPPAAGISRRTGLGGHSQLALSASGRGRPRRKYRRALGGGTQRADAAQWGDATAAGAGVHVTYRPGFRGVRPPGGDLWRRSNPGE